ncbi:integrase [Anoxybacillus calidus]|uniref:Integrase n=1 Tax=[Anoxybacillus] calidus TaxID=575178 RepID=A0A7W0BU89_9BACL|nr:integrase [Anoxybacillus calidus]
MTPHSLRHTYTSLLIEAGIGIKEIQQRLGHTTTMNIYAHMMKDLEKSFSKVQRTNEKRTTINE